jgi:hypothetical protein
MRTVNCGGSMMTPHLARAAVFGTGKRAREVRMHPAQVCAIAMLAETIAIESIQDLSKLEDIEAVKRLANEYEPSTFMGLKIKQDETMPLSSIEFCEDSGVVIGRIENLAIPLGFSDGR